MAFGDCDDAAYRRTRAAILAPWEELPDVEIEPATDPRTRPVHNRLQPGAGECPTGHGDYNPPQRARAPPTQTELGRGASQTLARLFPFGAGSLLRPTGAEAEVPSEHANGRPIVALRDRLHFLARARPGGPDLMARRAVPDPAPDLAAVRRYLEAMGEPGPAGDALYDALVSMVRELPAHVSDRL